MELSIPDNVWQASVQAAVDNWFAEHPPEPSPEPPPVGDFDIEVAFPADYTATITPVFPGGVREPWYFGRGAGDDFNDPNGSAWESAQQPASTQNGTLANLRTDRQVTVYARTDSGKRKEKTVQVPGAIKPQPQPPGNKMGLLGLFEWSQKSAPYKTMENTLGMVPATQDKPRLCVVHMDHSGDWGRLENAWFAGDWRNAGTQYRLVVTFCPWPTPMGNQYPAAARGDFDGHWRTMAQNILNNCTGLNSEIWLRFAHEANCCYVWKANNNVSEYKQMWQRASSVIRSVSNRFKLVYCPFYGAGSVGYDTLAPDPATYDRTGLDYYGYNNWRESETIKYGTEWYGNWTRNVVRKPGGFYESNPAKYPEVQSQSMSDDPAWMDSIFNVCKKYTLDFVSYNDDNADVHSYLPNSNWPQNTARFKTTFATAPTTGLTSDASISVHLPKFKDQKRIDYPCPENASKWQAEVFPDRDKVRS